MALKVPLRKLNKTDVSLSVIGLGCMSFASLSAVDEDAVIKTIDQAVEVGINHFNTATFYGVGVSESHLGKAIKKHGRDKFFIQSKFGILFNPDGTWAGFSAAPERVRIELEGTLSRLGTDYIDSYGPARVDPKVPIEETMKALAELVKEGKIRHIHLSEVSAETIRRAHKILPISFLESEFSLYALHLRKIVLPTLRELGISLLAYSPLGKGFLTQKFTTQADLPDLIKQWPRFDAENFEHNAQLARALEKIANKKGITLPQLAMSWVLSQGNDIYPIPGTKNPSRILENVTAVQISLTKEELDEIEGLIADFEVKGTRYPAHNTLHEDQ